jgi:hypothetical protein
MAIRDFPFFRISPFGSWKPILCMRLTNPENGFDTDSLALIDTGADRCAIPEHIAKRLGHEIDGPGVERGHIQGVAGDSETFLHTFQIEVYALKEHQGAAIVDYNRVVLRIPKVKWDVVPATRDARGHIVCNLPDVLIGVEDFLKDYKLVIDYPRKVFSLTQKRTPRRKTPAHF